MLVSPAMTTGCLRLRLRAVAYICMLAQNAARPAEGEQLACSLWRWMRVSHLLSVRIFRAAAFPGTSSVKVSTSCSATYFLLRLRQSAAEEAGEPFVPESHGHLHLLRPGGDPCLLEHYGTTPLLGQHAGDEVILVGTDRRPLGPSECVPEGQVRRDEAVAQDPAQGPQNVVRRILLESAVPHRHRRGVCRGWQGPAGRRGQEVRGARPQGGQQGVSGEPRGDGPLASCTASPRDHVDHLFCLIRGRCFVRRLGGGGLGVEGVPRRPPCPFLEDLGGVRKSHDHVFLGGLDPRQAPLKSLFVDVETSLIIFVLLLKL